MKERKLVGKEKKEKKERKGKGKEKEKKRKEGKMKDKEVEVKEECLSVGQCIGGGCDGVQVLSLSRLERCFFGQ